MECQETTNSKNKLEKNKVGGLTLPYFKTYSKPKLIKAMWNLHKTASQPVQQNKNIRNKLFHIWSNDVPQECQGHSIGEGQSTEQKVLRKLDIHIQKNVVGPLHDTHPIQKLTQNGSKI